MYRLRALVAQDTKPNIKKKLISPALKFFKNLAYISIEFHTSCAQKKYCLVIKVSSIYNIFILLKQINDVNIRQMQKSLAVYSR